MLMRCGATCATPTSSRPTSTTTSPPTSPQANHIGVTIEADIIKQKLPENNGGYNAFKGYGKTSKLVYDTLTTNHPIDLTRWQVANCYMGRAGLINSGGASSGESDLAEAVRTAVINKRAGGTGLISGRKAFQRPMAEGVELLNAIQDVYLDQSITIAQRAVRAGGGRDDAAGRDAEADRAHQREVGRVHQQRPVDVAEHQRPLEHDALVQRREPDDRLETRGIAREREERGREEEQRDERER